MKKTDQILDAYPQINRDVLIPVLQSVQDEYGYIPEEAVEQIGERLNLPSSKIYGLATFYNQFSFKPKGKYHIRVCNGSACHLDHSAMILKELFKQLGIRDGETTRDGMFSLEIQACFGACGQAPVISINGEYFPKVKPPRIREILESVKGKGNI